MSKKSKKNKGTNDEKKQENKNQTQNAESNN